MRTKSSHGYKLIGKWDEAFNKYKLQTGGMTFHSEAVADTYNRKLFALLMKKQSENMVFDESAIISIASELYQSAQSSYFGGSIDPNRMSLKAICSAIDDSDQIPSITSKNHSHKKSHQLHVFRIRIVNLTSNIYLSESEVKFLQSSVGGEYLIEHDVISCPAIDILTEKYPSVELMDKINSLAISAQRDRVIKSFKEEKLAIDIEELGFVARIKKNISQYMLKRSI